MTTGLSIKWPFSSSLGLLLIRKIPSTLVSGDFRDQSPFQPIPNPPNMLYHLVFPTSTTPSADNFKAKRDRVIAKAKVWIIRKRLQIERSHAQKLQKLINHNKLARSAYSGLIAKRTLARNATTAAARRPARRSARYVARAPTNAKVALIDHNNNPAQATDIVG